MVTSLLIPVFDLVAESNVVLWFGELVANLLIAIVAKVSINDFASIYSHFVCNVRSVTDFSKYGFQNVMNV